MQPINAALAIPNRPILLIGNPNLGKLALFALFTGHRVDVSTYPGTTVGLAPGCFGCLQQRFPVSQEIEQVK